MRTSTGTIDQALAADSIGFTVKLQSWKSRIYFSTYNDDNVADFARPVGDTDNPLAEAIWYDPSSGKVIALYVDNDDQLVIQVQGETEFVIKDKVLEGVLASDRRCRPSIMDGVILYYDALGTWNKAVLDMDRVLAGNQICAEAPSVFYEFPSGTNLGSGYLVSDNEAIILRIDEGGVRANFIDTDGNCHGSAGRFFNPTYVLLNTVDEDLYKLHYAAAVKALGSVFVYFTGYNGSAQCYRYLLSTANLKSGVWSDIHVVFPEDLSIFEISNAFSYNDRIFLCGRFKREEQFSSSSVYTLFTWSIDGFTFSLDRKTLFTIVDLRFLVAKADDDLVFWSAGRYHQEGAPYQVLGEDAESIVTKIVSISGDASTGWNVALKSGDEAYVDNLFLRNGAYGKLSIGIKTAAGTEWIKYHDVVISYRKFAYGDGLRDYDLSVVPDGFWHTAIMTHPLYMEVVGAQALLDEALALENLYKSSQSSGIQWTLACDLWSEENTPNGEGFTPQTHAAAATTDWWGPDLTQLCTDYPEFGDDATYEIRCFGWSRAGEWGTAPQPNPPDPTPTDTPNDDFYALVLYQDDNGDEIEIVSVIGDLVSDFSNPPQSYFEEGIRDGSYPVIYTIPNPGEGYKIVKLGIRVCASTGTTCYLPERIEMPGISASYINLGTQEGFEVKDVDSKWKLVDTITLQVTAGNDADGDLTSGSFDTRDGYVYLVAIQGDAEFVRAGTTEYLQDADFVASIASGAAGYLPLTWRRIYPPGTGPAQNSCVKVTSGDHPYFDGALVPVTWDDNIPPGVALNDGHVYTFHIDESARLVNSAIDARYVPYVYGSGSPLEVALYLAGSGAISGIVRGEFTFYVFESPIPFNEFKYYGGPTDDGDEDSVTVVIAGSSPDQNEWVETSAANNIISVTKAENVGDIDIRFELEYEFEAILNSGGSAHLDWSLNKIGAPFTMHYEGDVVEGESEGYEITDSDPHGATIQSVAWPQNLVREGTQLVNMTIKATAQVGSGFAHAWDMATSMTGVTSVRRYYRARWWLVGAVPLVPQVPVPPSLKYTLPTGNIDFDVRKLGASISNRKKGVPQALLAVKPYSAWNFDVIGRYRVVGNYSIAGLIGLSTDDENFVVGYIKVGFAGIAVIRNGQRTTIVEEAADIEENKLYDVRFWHRDGLFGLEAKTASEVWPSRGSMLLYEWLEDDGALATNDDIFHVGVYSIIDPPKFKLVGYRTGQGYMPVMPLDINPLTGTSDFLDSFPASGQVDVDGVIYNYTGKVEIFDDVTLPPMGPFQHRNITNWASEFARDLSGGHTFQGGLAMEFTQFNWWEGSAHADDFVGAIIGVNSGYNWLNDETQWKVWITTRGIVVYVRDRARYYADDIVPWYGSLEEKIWVTNGLSGISAEEETDETYVHNEGAFVFIHSDDEIELSGFMAANGDHALTIRSLLQQFCRIAGTNTSFPGDITIDTSTLIAGEEVTIE